MIGLKKIKKMIKKKLTSVVKVHHQHLTTLPRCGQYRKLQYITVLFTETLQILIDTIHINIMMMIITIQTSDVQALSSTFT